MLRSFKGMTPKIHPDAFVSEFAYVVGDVEIGAGSSIWPGVVIRGEIPPAMSSPSVATWSGRRRVRLNSSVTRLRMAWWR